MLSILDALGIAIENISLKENRKKTLAFWPINFIDKDDMAEAGFYYDGLGSPDAVRCFSCEIALNNWEEGDEPFTEHKKWSADCEYLNENFKLPKYRQFQSTSSRMSTFEDWPISLPVKPKNLSEAGFFYTRMGDKCVCYQCGVALKNWEVNDEAWEEHIKWSSDCKHVELMKGVEFIKCTKAKLESRSSGKENEKEISDLSQSFDLSISGNNNDDRYTCGICFDGQREIALIPCGHTFCPNCSLNLNKCAVCRKDIKGRLRLYY